MSEEESKKILVDEKLTLEEPANTPLIETIYFKVGLTAFLTFVACALVFFALLRFEGFSSGWGKLLQAGQSIIIGLVIAFILSPIKQRMELWLLDKLKPRMKSELKAKKLARGLSVFGAITFFVLIIAILIAAIVPSIISSISSLIQTLPDQVQSFVERLENWNFGNKKVAEVIGTTMTQAVDYIEDWAQTKLLPEAQTYIAQITATVYSVFKALLNFIIGIIVAVYVLMTQETLAGQAKKTVYAIFKPKYGNIIIHTVRKSSEIFGGFISGKLVDSLIIGILAYIGLVILRMPSPMLLAFIIGVTNVVPFFGPFIGAVPCVLLVLIQSPIQALYLIIFILVLQQVDGNIIGPKILGDSTGLTSFWVMFAILVFGGLWGFIGMLLGVPIMAVIYYICSKMVKAGLKKQELPTDTRDYILARGVNEDGKTLRYATPEEKKEKIRKRSFFSKRKSKE